MENGQKIYTPFLKTHAEHHPLIEALLDEYHHKNFYKDWSDLRNSLDTNMYDLSMIFYKHLIVVKFV